MTATPVCCCVHPVATAHLGPALLGASTAIEPARYGRGRGAHLYRAADLLVVGRISTGDAARPIVEAMAISDGAIVALGDRHEVEHLAGPHTDIVMPDGTVIPGLIEPHMHIWAPLLTVDWTDVSHTACPTFDDVVAVIRREAEQAAPGAFVLAKRFDPSVFPGEPLLTRDLLDRIAPDLTESIGYTGAAHWAVVLTDVLEDLLGPPQRTARHEDDRDAAPTSWRAAPHPMHRRRSGGTAATSCRQARGTMSRRRGRAPASSRGDEPRGGS